MKISISIISSAIVATLAGGIVASTLLLHSAAAADKDTPAAPPAIVTVYIDEHFSSVTKINEAHNTYFAKGYRFAGMTSHQENGDHKGLWITYVLKE
ncbi:MAG TPA: hypothetical protein VEZ88_13210 [Steroidobacteraceae bacterium]|nr:hypothetical protein [Steroidobacteraceae bacterium]